MLYMNVYYFITMINISYYECFHYSRAILLFSQWFRSTSQGNQIRVQEWCYPDISETSAAQLFYYQPLYTSHFANPWLPSTLLPLLCI